MTKNHMTIEELMDALGEWTHKVRGCTSWGAALSAYDKERQACVKEFNRRYEQTHGVRLAFTPTTLSNDTHKVSGSERVDLVIPDHKEPLKGPEMTRTFIDEAAPFATAAVNRLSVGGSGGGGAVKIMWADMPISKSYPLLSIARKYGVPYADVLLWADYQDQLHLQHKDVQHAACVRLTAKLRTDAQFGAFVGEIMEHVARLKQNMAHVARSL